LPQDVFKFACYVAIAHMKYGASYESVTANRIFGFVTALGSNLPAHLKKHGSGDLPQVLLEYQDAALSCKANDAFAAIKITLKQEAEAHYAKILDFLCALLSAEFPRSYSIDFRSPQKNYLPIRGLPKKGVHQLFANAIQYAALHGKIEHYARLAMRQYEWYTNLEAEDCAMPGSFAVFALGLHDEAHAPLLMDYFALCDDEHQSVQEKFLAAYIAKFGFNQRTVKVFIAGAGSMQELPHNKIHEQAIANEASLRCFQQARADADANAWDNALYAIWGNHTNPVRDSLEKNVE
jgi:hypothetical protein